jgi:hypothetical protein
VASSHKSHTKSSNQHHEEETLSTSPKIENLGQRNEDGGVHAAGDNTDNGNQRVRLPLADSVGLESPSNAGLESVGEVDEPHPVHGQLLNP